MLEHVEEIRADDVLYRRLAPQSTVQPDRSINSNAYKYNGKPSSTVSVDLARLTTPQRAANFAGRTGFLLGAITVADVRRCGFTVRHLPVPSNPAHCVIEGAATAQSCRDLARATILVPNVVSTAPETRDV